MDKQAAFADYTRKCIVMGRITLLAGLVASFVPALTLALVYGYMPPASAILTGCGILFPFLIGGWIVEPTAFFPVLGISGSYLAWMTGNVGNVRIPAAVMAQETAGVEEGSPEAEYVGTLGIGVSVIISIAFLAVGAIGGASLISALPERFNTALSYILPAVFGAILVNFSVKAPHLGVIGLGVSIVLNLLGAPTWATMLLTVFGLVALAFLMDHFKKKRKAPAGK